MRSIQFRCKKQIYPNLMVTLLSVGLLSCSSVNGNEESGFPVDRDQFNDYWYAGEAEITRYALQQARYGEIREGDAVLIFVTEDFLTDKQVKHEYGDSDNSTSVLKLNFTRKFYTGIYPYSMMTSIFTPVDVNSYSTLKVTSTSQEWCGHTFLQLNARDDKLHVTSRSYFQSEGDRDFQIDSVVLEDELWTLVRLAPDKLPVGEFEIVPGSQFSRFRHTEIKPSTATAQLSTEQDASLSEAALLVYTLNYPKLERQLTIKFEKSFPHRILAWEEKYKSGYGPNAKVMTTTAVKTHQIKSAYWSKNQRADAHLREHLGLID